MIKISISKLLYIRFDAWKSEMKDNILSKELPEDADIVERYIYDFNRFISPGDWYYCQLHAYVDNSTSLAEIESIIVGFKNLGSNSFKFPTAMLCLLCKWVP